MLVQQWYRDRGFYVTATSCIAEPGQRHGPRMTDRDSGLVLPDMQVCRDGEIRWVEIKGKSRDVLYNKTQTLKQGIDRFYFNQYLKVQRESGIPGWLALMVLTSGDTGTAVLRMQSLSKLAQYATSCNGSRDAFGGSDMVFWPVDIFINFDIAQHGLSPQKPMTSYPWDSAPKPPPKTTQDYFDFDGNGTN